MLIEITKVISLLIHPCGFIPIGVSWTVLAGGARGTARGRSSAARSVQGDPGMAVAVVVVVVVVVVV
eukprot:11985795-Heterocapsa_arctica.AAC.1